VDITSRKLAEEELEQAGRRKDEFLAMLGHELRNPLAPIGMAVEVLRNQGPDDDSVAWARDVIARQLRQLTRLVDDLLDVSRITRGKVTLLLTPLDVASVVAQAVETSRPLIESRGHQLTTHVPADSPWVRGDVVRLGQVLANLLNNAAKYTPPGGRIRMTVSHRDSHVTLTVADSGRGLPADALDRVFDLFWQLDSRDHAQRGLGIGLTLVKRLVELHGGVIEARSDGPGRGSEFVVRLPALAAQGEAPAVATRAATRSHLGRHRILVVDDNVDAAEALARILQLQNQEVSVAHDGEAALRVAGATQPEIVFLDLGLPTMGGLEVAQRLRTGSHARPLLVATTGFGGPEDRRRTAEAGFDHHLVKPIDPQVLRALLASVG
jgi:CheY-like chemotaxis protein/two-component sensor histidine kinase